ncbi:MAG: hypothetical protein D6714_04005 [Bacteroidetes bacterium]|nr:MAG: hypothetical protein D6714_04005 [Bacteroidota bacterium]
MTSLTIQSIYGQGTANGYLYVQPNDPTAYPSGSGNATGNTLLNSIFTTHNVIEYKQSFPGATNAFLANAYEIHLNGFPDSLAYALWNTNLFSQVETASYYTIADCPNPMSINDPIPNGTNGDGWELEAIDAYCAWTITTGDPAITVGVADTEFDESHDDLVDNLIYHEDDSATPMPDCRHGTLVSGLVSAKPNNNAWTAGIGYNTTIAGYVVNTSTFCTGQPWQAVWRAFIDGT